jgi:cytochrome c553
VGPADRPLVDPAAVRRGQPIWDAACASCHGPSARGTERAPSLLRSLVILRDRQGSVLGPFLAAGHPAQAPVPAFSHDQLVDLTNLIRQRINDTLRGSPVFTERDILVGNAARGAVYFSGDGRCTTCHSATGDLAGIGARYANPVDLQQRMLFPPRGRGAGSGRGGNRSTVMVTITTGSGAPVTGALVQEDDFFVLLRDSTGVTRAFRRGPGVQVAIVDPLEAHHQLLDRLTDDTIHDLTAYLVTLQ